MASIMTVHEDGTRTFAVYDAAEENERDRGKIAGRMVCHPPDTTFKFADVRYQNMPYFV